VYHRVRLQVDALTERPPFEGCDNLEPNEIVGDLLLPLLQVDMTQFIVSEANVVYRPMNGSRSEAVPPYRNFLAPRPISRSPRKD